MRFAALNTSCVLIDIPAGADRVRDYCAYPDGYAALFPYYNSPTHLDIVGRVKEQHDVPVAIHMQERIAPAISVSTLTGTLRFTRPTTHQHTSIS